MVVGGRERGGVAGGGWQGEREERERDKCVGHRPTSGPVLASHPQFSPHLPLCCWCTTRTHRNKLSSFVRSQEVIYYTVEPQHSWTMKIMFLWEVCRN